MAVSLLNYFRLLWSLLGDKRVSGWLKTILVGSVIGFAIIPTLDDFIPIIGMIDELIFFGFCSYVFILGSPASVVNEHRLNISNSEDKPETTKLDWARNHDEQKDLAIGFLSTFLLFVLGGWYAGTAGLFLYVAGYLSSYFMRAQMLNNAVRVSDNQLKNINEIFETTLNNIPNINVDLFVTQSPIMNAYTFGYSEPYSIVLTSALIERLNNEEIAAVMGHELGHIYFGHTRLVGLMGGAQGPTQLLFYKWRRTSEYSADNAALIATNNNYEAVISALLKISSGLKDLEIDMESFINQSEGDVRAFKIAEMVSTHPFMTNRIQNILDIRSGVATERVKYKLIFDE